MPMFYFNMIGPFGGLTDEEGADLPTLEDARREAERGARELIGEATETGQPLDVTAIEVLDSARRQVATIHVSDLVPKAPGAPRDPGGPSDRQEAAPEPKA